MKILCRIIAIMLLCPALALIYITHYNTIFSEIFSLTTSNTIITLLIILISSFVSGFMFNQAKIEEFKADSTKQLRKAEKANIDTKESLDKIERLNAKIETLEIALKEAIKRKEGN